MGALETRGHASRVVSFTMYMFGPALKDSYLGPAFICRLLGGIFGSVRLASEFGIKEEQVLCKRLASLATWGPFGQKGVCVCVCVCVCLKVPFGPV